MDNYYLNISDHELHIKFQKYPELDASIEIFCEQREVLEISPGDRNSGGRTN